MRESSRATETQSQNQKGRRSVISLERPPQPPQTRVPIIAATLVERIRVSPSQTRSKSSRPSRGSHSQDRIVTNSSNNSSSCSSSSTNKTNEMALLHHSPHLLHPLILNNGNNSSSSFKTAEKEAPKNPQIRISSTTCSISNNSILKT